MYSILMKLRSLLLITNALLISALLLGAGVFVYVMAHLQHNSLLSEESIESIEAAEKVEADLLQHGRLSLLSIIDNQNDYELKLKLLAKSILGKLENYKRFANDKEELALLLQTNSQVRTYLEMQGRPVTEIFSPVDQRNISRQLDLSNDSLKKLIEINLAQARAIYGTIAWYNRFAVWVGGASSIFIVIFIILIYFFANRLLYQPIFHLQRDIERFGKGNSEARAQLNGPFEIRSIATTFNDMADRLAQSNKNQLSFLSSVAHDIRNPLNAIKLSAELIIHTGEGIPAKAKKSLEIIKRQSTHLDRLVGDLLDTTRIEAGNFELLKIKEDVRNAVRDSVHLHSDLLEGHTIALKLEEVPMMCAFDPVRVNQILNNLINNALKYSPDGGEVKVSVWKEEKFNFISVEDQGIGIAESDIKGIFEPFRRTHSTRETIPGIGLGLSVARKLALAHGGDLSVKSELGRGSCFTLSLPL